MSSTSDSGNNVRFKQLRYVRNTYISPFERVLQFTDGISPPDTHDTYESHLDSEKQNLINGKYFSGIRDKSTVPYISLAQQYDVLFVTPNNNGITQRVLNSLPSINENDELIGAPGEVAVASRAAMLYQRSNNKEYIYNSGKNNLDFIFTAHIAVTVPPAKYISAANSSDCYDYDGLLEFIAEKLRIYISDNNLAVNCGIWHSLHMGDFVVEVFCDKTLDALAITSEIITNPKLQMNTQTSIATTVVLDGEGQIKTPVFDESESFQLYFKASEDYMRKLNTAVNANGLKAEFSADGNVSNALFGYYDVALMFDAKQFSCVYPSLCNYRLFKDSLYMKTNNESEDAEFCDCQKCGKQNCLASVIRSELLRGSKSEIIALSVEPRCKLNLYANHVDNSASSARAVSDRAERAVRIEYVRKKAFDLSKRIICLRGLASKMPVHHAEYKKAVGMLWDLIQLYGEIGAPSDMFLTWYTIYEFIDNFVRSIEFGITEIEKRMEYFYSAPENDSEHRRVIRSHCEELMIFIIKMIRNGVTGISRFCRLSLAVNPQFFGAANHDTHTRLNAEKLIIAMSEYINSVANAIHVNRQDNDRRLSVIVVPEMNALVPQSKRLFPHGYLQREEIPDEEFPAHPILFSLTGFDQFLNLYDTIPYLHHELAHFQHNFSDEKIFCQRAQRNKIISFIAFTEVADFMLRALIGAAELDYTMFKRVSSFAVLRDALVDVMWKQFRKTTPESSNALLAVIKTLLQNFIIDINGIDTANTNMHVNRRDAVNTYCALIIRYGGENFNRDELQRFKKKAYSYPKTIYTMEPEEIFVPAEEQRINIVNDANVFLKGINDIIKTHKDEASRFRSKKELIWAYDNFIDSLDAQEHNDDETGKSRKPREEFRESARNILIEKAEKVLDDISTDSVSTEKSKNPLPYYELQTLNAVIHTLNCDSDYIFELWRLPYAEITERVNQSWVSYNEFLSDLYMCASLDFNIAGYLYFHASDNYRGLAAVDVQDVMLKRTQMVVAALSNTCKLKSNETNSNELFLSLLKTKLTEIGYIILEAIPLQLKTHYHITHTDNKTSYLIHHFSGFFKENSTHSLPINYHPDIKTLNLLYELDKLNVAPEKMSVKHLAEAQEKLYNIILFCDMIGKLRRINVVSPLSGDVKKHIVRKYEKMISAKKNDTVSTEQNNVKTENITQRYVENISKYINGEYGDGLDYSEQSKAMLSVEFIAEMYYHNRVRVMKKVTEDPDWQSGNSREEIERDVGSAPS